MSWWHKAENFVKEASPFNMISATSLPGIQGAVGARKAGTEGKAAADPFSGYRSGSAGMLEALMGGDISSITSSPAYQAEVAQATRGIDRKAAAAGMFGSGNMLEQLTQSAAGIATRDFNQQWNLLSMMSGNAQYDPSTLAKLYADQKQQDQGAVGGVLDTMGLGSLKGLTGFL